MQLQITPNFVSTIPHGLIHDAVLTYPPFRINSYLYLCVHTAKGTGKSRLIRALNASDEGVSVDTVEQATDSAR